jgi:hypothetical protein
MILKIISKVGIIPKKSLIKKYGKLMVRSKRNFYFYGKGLFIPFGIFIK